MPKDRTGEEVERVGFESVLKHRCSWETHGRRCYLTGSMSQGSGEGAKRYCHWHYVNLTRPQFAESFQEFEAWQRHWVGYCSEETHWSNGDLWEAITGNHDLPLYRRQNCGSFRCPVPGAKAPRPTPMDPLFVRQEVKALEDKLSAQNRRRDLDAEKQALATIAQPESPRADQ